METYHILEQRATRDNRLVIYSVVQVLLRYAEMQHAPVRAPINIMLQFPTPQLHAVFEKFHYGVAQFVRLENNDVSSVNTA